MLFRKSSKEFVAGPNEIVADHLIDHGILEILKQPGLGSNDFPWEKLGHMTLRHLDASSGRTKSINTLLTYFSGNLSHYDGYNKPRNWVPFSLFEEPDGAYSVAVGHGGLRISDPFEVITVLLPSQLSVDVGELISRFDTDLPDAPIVSV